MWFIGVEVEEETSAPPPKNNPGSAPVITVCLKYLIHGYWGPNEKENKDLFLVHYWHYKRNFIIDSDVIDCS